VKQSRRRPAVPESDAGSLTRDELRRLEKAERKLASPDRAQSAGGHREIRDLERRRDERVEDQSLAFRLGETSSLALSRGEEVKSETIRLAVPIVDEHGARIVRHGLPLYRQETHTRVRIASRGGLQLAFERGDLDGGRLKAERLHETGKAYRWAFETNSALTTPERNLAPISGRSPMRASAGPQDAVFAAGEILRVCRADLTARQLAVLDRVCGLEMTIRAASLRLKADARTIRRLLVEALTIATENQKASAESSAA
jgi:hypothetical protein